MTPDVLIVGCQQEVLVKFPDWPFTMPKHFHFKPFYCLFKTGFPSGAVVKNTPANAGDARDMGSIPGSGRSPGEGDGHPLQYSHLGKPHGQRSLVGYSPWGHKESDTTERRNTHK